MAARMHLALDRAFLRHLEPVGDWVDQGEQAIAAADPSLLEDPGVGEFLSGLRQPGLRSAVLRTHGDFSVARTARTDHGWVVTDCAPGSRMQTPRTCCSSMTCWASPIPMLLFRLSIPMPGGGG